MLNEIWVTLFTLIKSITGDVDVKNKGTLQEQIDDCFQSASNGKAAIASAITGKGVSTTPDATFATMAANIKNIKTSPNLQAKNAALGTSAQTIKPDTGYDGLSQVSIPAVSGTAGTGDVLSGKTFSSGSAGISKTGTMANRGAWTGATTGNGNVTIPAGYHNGSGYVSGAGAYNKGVSDADARANTNSTNYKTGYNAGVSDADARTNTSSENYKSGYSAGVSATKVGTAGSGDVLTGKTFTNSGSVGAGGTMANKGGTTVDAGAVTRDNDYTYFSVPANGYYNTNSKLRAQNGNIASVSGVFFGLPFIISRSGSGTQQNSGNNNARLYINNRNALTLSGNFVSSSGSSTTLTISGFKDGGTYEIINIKNSGSNQTKSFSGTIAAGTEYIEVTVSVGSTGQPNSYTVSLLSLA